MNNTHQAISQLCANLGKDRLLVQGPGGNVSWKENGVLWVKGSGTWLAKADQENIFVPVDLVHLQKALSDEFFEIKPQVIAGEVEQKLRPSIETVLHALMPQKIVVHLHAINALSYLVTEDCTTSLQRLFAKTSNEQIINYLLVDYHKPGSELAKAIYQALQTNAAANAVFLKNHGLVIGAESIEAINALLKAINMLCAPRHIPPSESYSRTAKVSAFEEYIPFPNDQVQALALNPDLYKRIQSDWVLFPDHAVFLGPKAFTYTSWMDFSDQAKNNIDKPELIFIENTGIFVSPSFNKSKTAQLICYFDVISRVSLDIKLSPLSDSSVKDLINWDAEKHRIGLAN